MNTEIRQEIQDLSVDLTLLLQRFKNLKRKLSSDPFNKDYQIVNDAAVHISNAITSLVSNE